VDGFTISLLLLRSVELGAVSGQASWCLMPFFVGIGCKQAAWRLGSGRRPAKESPNTPRAALRYDIAGLVYATSFNQV